MKGTTLGICLGMLAGIGLSAAASLAFGQSQGADRATAAPSQSAAAIACNRPAYLVVWIEDLNREKSAAYGAALRKSRIVARHGGEYLAVSPPTQLLEGEWPADRGFVIERYPCMQALRDFWFSDEYQEEIKPLRADSGHYIVGAFEEFRRPE